MTHETPGQILFIIAQWVILIALGVGAAVFALVFVVRFAWELAGGLL